MCYSLLDGAHKRYLAANRKVSHGVATTGLHSLAEWSFTICPTPFKGT